MAARKTAQKTRSTALGKQRPKANPQLKRTATVESDQESGETDAYEEPASEEDVESAKEYDSDALDEDSDQGASRKRKRGVPAKPTPKRSRASPRKKSKRGAPNGDDEAESLYLEEGQEVAGVVVQAPKTGRGGALSSIDSRTFFLPTRHSSPRANFAKYSRLLEQTEGPQI